METCAAQPCGPDWSGGFMQSLHSSKNAPVVAVAQMLTRGAVAEAVPPSFWHPSIARRVHDGYAQAARRSHSPDAG